MVFQLLPKSTFRSLGSSSKTTLENDPCFIKKNLSLFFILFLTQDFEMASTRRCNFNQHVNSKQSFQFCFYVFEVSVFDRFSSFPYKKGIDREQRNFRSSHTFFIFFLFLGNKKKVSFKKNQLKLALRARAIMIFFSLVFALEMVPTCLSLKMENIDKQRREMRRGFSD